MSSSDKAVFVSYRRSVSQHFARLIRNELKTLGYDVFLDVENIGPGEFEKVILTEIQARPHFVVLIEEGSLERCDEEGDWLQRECLEAHRLGRNIVPLLGNGLTMAEIESQLSEDLQFLACLNSLTMNHEFWEASVEKLDRFLQVPVSSLDLVKRTAEQVAEVERKELLVEETAAVPVTPVAVLAEPKEQDRKAETPNNWFKKLPAVAKLAEVAEVAAGAVREAAERQRFLEERREKWEVHWEKFQELRQNHHFPPERARETLALICNRYETEFPLDWDGESDLVPVWNGNELELITGNEYRFDPGFGFTMPMCFVKPGELELEDRTLVVEKGFWIGKFPVTQAEWVTVMRNNPSKFSRAGWTAPVEKVSWEDTRVFFKKVGKGFRLPTETEWEYACRAGTKGKFNVEGRVYLDDIAWWSNNGGRTTHPVGQKLPNAWGLHDMHGNVSEWCEDWYDKAKQCRVLRGGSFRHYNQNDLSSSQRDYDVPSKRSHNVGFRCVRDA